MAGQLRAMMVEGGGGTSVVTGLLAEGWRHRCSEECGGGQSAMAVEGARELSAMAGGKSAE
jgi:hypothetical protein